MRTIFVTVNNELFHIFRVKQMLLHLYGEVEFHRLWLDKSNLNSGGCGLVKGSVNTSFCVQLVFAPNRKSTFSASDGAMNYYCQMIPFTSRFELELLILFIYWNIKSLICQLSGPSFIILAAACPMGLEGFPSNDFWSNCPRLFPFLRLSFAFRLQLFSIGSCLSASQCPCFYLPDVPVFRHAHAAELIKKLAFEHQFITRHHFVI